MSYRTDQPATSSILIVENYEMERKRRAVEKSGHRSRLKIKVAEPLHQEREQRQQQATFEEGMRRETKRHAWMDSQRLDGLPPEMILDELDLENKLREQEMENKLKLGLTPGSSPKFRPPGM